MLGLGEHNPICRPMQAPPSHAQVQNASFQQLKLLTTRLGEGSKLCILGDGTPWLGLGLGLGLGLRLVRVRVS